MTNIVIFKLRIMRKARIVRFKLRIVRQKKKKSRLAFLFYSWLKQIKLDIARGKLRIAILRKKVRIVG